MPNNRKQKRQSGKSKKAGSRAPIPTTLQVVPPAYHRVFLAYHHLGTITEPATSTGGIHQFRLNSVYDPDFTGVGTTAMGYDAITRLYQLFRVVRARVVVRFAMSTTGTATVGMLAGLNTTVSSNFHMLEAEPNAVSRVIQGNAGGGHSIAQFNRVYNLAKIAGITRSQYQTDFDFAHYAGSNPLKPLILTCYMAGNSGAVQTVILNTRLIYEVECSQPLQSVMS